MAPSGVADAAPPAASAGRATRAPTFTVRLAQAELWSGAAEDTHELRSEGVQSQRPDGVARPCQAGFVGEDYESGAGTGVELGDSPAGRGPVMWFAKAHVVRESVNTFPGSVHAFA